MPSTAEDFWRMVVEHNISTMVMLSADCAWNYWEEEKQARFGAMAVTLNSTEKLPSYVKREFSILNEKVGRSFARAPLALAFRYSECYFAFPRPRTTPT